MKYLYLTPKRAFYGLLMLFFSCMQLSSKAYQLMSTNFYVVANGVPTLKDGNISLYDTPYSNGVDWNDGTKMNNAGENWGLIRNTVSLVVERRQSVTGADTAFFNMWGMQQRDYRFEVTMQNFDPLTIAAYVWDNYLHKITPVDLSSLTTVDFTVDANAASSAAGRFQLIYTTPAQYAAKIAAVFGPLPVTLTGIHAVRKDGGDVSVTWSVENEISMDNYSVENSLDGLHFKPLATVEAKNATGSHSYDHIDKTAGDEDQYYRIKANSKNGKSAYSNVAKVAHNDRSSVSVYPNPVVNKNAQVQWDNISAARMHTSLVYPNGSRQLLNIMNIPAGRSTCRIALPASLPAGIYQLQFTDEQGHTQAKTMIVL